MEPDGDKDRGRAYPGVTGAVGVVTGAAQGIGEAVARALAWHGASVMIVDREGDRAERLATELGGRGTCAAFARADVSDAASVESMVVQAELQLGPIDILVNAAGVLRTGPVVDTDEGDWREPFAVNATGVFLVSRAVAKRMISRRSGSIVTVGSNATAVVRTEMAAYAASKAAATAFTKCLGLELAAFGIRCNVVSPESTDTPMQRA